MLQVEKITSCNCQMDVKQLTAALFYDVLFTLLFLSLYYWQNNGRLWANYENAPHSGKTENIQIVTDHTYNAPVRKI